MLSKHYVVDNSAKEIPASFTWTVMWENKIVCFAPSKEYAIQIAKALDYGNNVVPLINVSED